jgi:hypothetical protein
LALVSTLILIEIAHAYDVVGNAIPAIVREPLIKRVCNSEIYRCADISAKECKSFASLSFTACPFNSSVVNEVKRDGSESNWDALIKEFQYLDTCFSVEFSALLEVNGVSADCISTAVGDLGNIEEDGEENESTESNSD